MTVVDSDAQPVTTTVASVDLSAQKPKFAPIKVSEASSKGKTAKESRMIPIPPHRLTPLKNEWMNIYTPLVEHMKLQIRMVLRTRSVELRNGPETTHETSLQKGADFVRAFAMGFAIEDAIALLRMDDLYLETFEVKDVKTLHGDNLSRAIGRIAGKDGKTKFAIENTSRTRIVVADSKIHILGTFQNIRMARRAISHLIMGSSPGKVYARLRNVSARLQERY
ncbi:hypothetical protein CXG81DRAFT_29362 [Caulochytrium protostelioides]|uniref:Pre-rRNA-processing protein PNO1 n=1 Tax=Caulochytrium protostelioides TaxID=1555241 RepID=A0A4P9XCH8_9FUNG|nr:hypothetical protein CXG81DRAFT_29362 [Caulochytrium protostelioides]|eukprot:RKP03122.1 hypothetical protein CXG81DRAFT_29362 [Caulochytrium protostelioides]